MLKGKIRKGGVSVSESFDQAWDEAMLAALRSGDKAAIERLYNIALDQLLIAKVAL